MARVRTETFLLHKGALKATRRLRGLSQRQLAVKADLHKTYVSVLECTDRQPSLAVAEALAAALDVSLDELVVWCHHDKPTGQVAS